MDYNIEKTARRVYRTDKGNSNKKYPTPSSSNKILSHLKRNKLPYSLGIGIPAATTVGYLASENSEVFQDPEFKKVRNDIAAGSISGAISGAAVHPIDNWVVGLQSGKDAAKKITFKDNLKSLGGKVIKTTAAAGIGYPAYMYASRALSGDKEKTASYIENSEKVLISMRGFSDTMEKTATPWGLAVGASRLVKPLKAAFSSLKPVKDFTTSFAGVSRTPFTSTASKVGTGTSIGSSMAIMGKPKSILETQTRNIKQPLNKV